MSRDVLLRSMRFEAGAPGSRRGTPGARRGSSAARVVRHANRPWHELRKIPDGARQSLRQAGPGAPAERLAREADVRATLRRIVARQGPELDARFRTRQVD